MRNPETRKIPRLRKIISSLTVIVEVKIEASQVNLWVGFSKNILVQIRKANKANFLMPPSIGNNTIITKKDEKQDNKDLYQVKCYAYYKMGYYANKCLDKKLKN